MTRKPVEVYCEHSALSKPLRELASSGLINLRHFPHDPDSRSRKLNLAPPASIAWAQANQLSWAEMQPLGVSWEQAAEAGSISAILSIIGPQHRADAQHLESARRTSCAAFVTTDSDILDKSEPLETLLGLRILSRDNCATELRSMWEQGTT